MSTVAWRGKIMAADSLQVSGGIIGRFTKLRRSYSWIVGGVGNSVDLLAFFEWHRNGADLNSLPRMITYSDTDKPDFEALVLSKGAIEVWNQYFQPTPIEDPFWAIGTGAMAALGAMQMGADPKTAVTVAAEVDCLTGGEIVVYEL